MVSHSKHNRTTNQPLIRTAFFQQQYRPTPHLNAGYWSFMLGGMVDVPLLLSYADLRAFPEVETDCVIACIGNPPGGPYIGQARWNGVAMQNILDEVTIRPQAQYAHLFAADGYTTFIELDALKRSILVHGMNGAPLPPAHGYPVRLVMPGHYGYKMPKWIQRILLTDSPAAGLWEQRGWSPSGQVQTTSRITAPAHHATLVGPTLLRGTAYAGDRAIVNVEISIDHGPWMPVPFTQPAADALAEWQIEWTAHAPGEHLIAVRATDDTGFTQPDSAETSPFPNGSSGQHSIVVYA